MADTTCTEEFNIVSTASRQATAERRAAREAEITRLGEADRTSQGRP